jgi:hypothetical protein
VQRFYLTKRSFLALFRYISTSLLYLAVLSEQKNLQLELLSLSPKFNSPKYLLQINDRHHFNREYIRDLRQKNQHVLIAAVMARHGPDMSQTAHHVWNDGNDKRKVVFVSNFLCFFGSIEGKWMWENLHTKHETREKR